MPSSRGSSQPRDRTQVFHVAGGFLTAWTTREAHQSCEVINRVEGFRVFVCLFAFVFSYEIISASARKVFPTKDFQVKSKSCFPMHFWPPPLQILSLPLKILLRERRERKKKTHTDWGRERDLLWETHLREKLCHRNDGPICMHCEELSQTNIEGPRECQADEDNDRLAAFLLLSLLPRVIFPLGVVDSGWGVKSSSPNYCLCISLRNICYTCYMYIWACLYLLYVFYLYL